MKAARPTLIVIGIWLAMTLVYGYLTVRAKQALPPSGDLYTNSASFQALSFVLGKVPALFAILLVIFAFQIIFLHARASLVTPGSIRLFRGTALVGIIVLAGALAHYVMTATIERNPWYQPTEQLILTFMLGRLPVLAFILLLVLGGEIWWLKSRAR